MGKRRSHSDNKENEEEPPKKIFRSPQSKAANISLPIKCVDENNNVSMNDLAENVSLGDPTEKSHSKLSKSTQTNSSSLSKKSDNDNSSISFDDAQKEAATPAANTVDQSNGQFDSNIEQHDIDVEQSNDEHSTATEALLMTFNSSEFRRMLLTSPPDNGKNVGEVTQEASVIQF